VAAVPYDVVSTEEARALTRDEPLSFLFVSRPDIEFPDGTSPYADEVYAKAVTNFEVLKRHAPLVVEETESLYVYRLLMGEHRQVGVAAAFSIDEYESHLIKRHEKTRREKEDDRTRHIIELRAQTGPVFLTYRATDDIRSITEAVTKELPLFDFTAADGVRHTVWTVPPAFVPPLQAGFARVDALYIADGHHRAASAARARAEIGGSNGMLAVAFPHDEVQILAYNRVIRDFGGLDAASFAGRLRDDFGASEGPSVPLRRGEVSVFVGDRWFTVPLRKDDTPSAGGRLDVARLQEQILTPMLGIGDVTRDPRIDFVGGGRGPGALERLVRSGEAAVAFSLHPVSIDDIMQISDAGGIMPPKSTWFEPKLRDGLLSHDLHFPV
jgi:uncharacterized protein (DUF1015 family)